MTQMSLEEVKAVATSYFEKYRRQYDPTNRLLNNFFRELLPTSEEI